jgi:predicted amidohydrolase
MVGVDLVGEMSQGPWRGCTYGGSSFVADGRGEILMTLRDRDTDLRVIELKLGSGSK